MSKKRANLLLLLLPVLLTVTMAINGFNKRIKWLVMFMFISGCLNTIAILLITIKLLG